MKPRIIALLALCLIAILWVVMDRTGNPASPPSSTDENTAASRKIPQGEDPESTRKPRQESREADRLLKAEGAKTDVTLSTFPATEYQHLPTPAGKPAGVSAGEAFIHVPSASRRVAMEANQIGEFPSIPTKINDTVGVRLILDAVKPGTPVRVVLLDGGSFPNVTGASRALKAADWHGIAFEFTTSGNVGTHRVLVQAVGQPARIFDFSAYDAKAGWPAPTLTSSN